MQIQFLAATVPLTKGYTLGENNELIKSNYPNISNFTSHSETCKDLAQLHKAISDHAKKGHCLLKGKLHAPLLNQSRAGSTTTDDTTNWICLDFDKAPFTDPEAALAAICIGTAESPFKDVSYVVQYSASHGIPGTVGLNCHIFMQLSTQHHAPYLKAWLMYLNLSAKSLANSISLSATNTHLSWPLDITTCQNDKLLFIAPPVLGRGIKCSLKESERYQLVVKKHQTLPTTRITNMDMNTVRALAHEMKTELREAKGMPRVRNTAPKQDGDHLIISNPGTSIITGIRTDDEFTHMNLNGGDSWSYWHPNDDYEFIRCFKHPDEWIRTKDLLPGYYAEKERIRIGEQTTPTAQGEHIITIRDRRSSTYWAGIWDAKETKLTLDMASNVTMLTDFRMQHNKGELDFIPTWDIKFDPHSNTVYDPENKTINTYIPNEYMRTTYKGKGNLKNCPLILKTFMHALNCERDSDVLEHWLNWLAVIYQKRVKTRTVWVLSGVEGTGKGVITNHIIAPTLGKNYVAHQDGAILEDQFNGWIENKLFVTLNEVDITSSALSKKIKTKLKHWTTEPTLPIRRMHSGSYETENYSNFLMSTNEIEMVNLSADDRRYNIGNYQSEKLVYTERDIKAIYKEHEAFMEYIMTRKADEEYAGTILKTEARQQLVEKSRTSSEAIAHAINTGDFATLYDVKPDMDYLVNIHGMNTGYAAVYHDMLKREAIAIVNMGTALSKDIVTLGSKLSREDLLATFEYTVGNMPLTPIKFTLFLKHKNINVEPLRIGEKIIRGTYVKWHVSRDLLEELRAWITPAAKLVSSTKTKPSVSKAKIKIVGD